MLHVRHLRSLIYLLCVSALTAARYLILQYTRLYVGDAGQTDGHPDRLEPKKPFLDLALDQLPFPLLPSTGVIPIGCESSSLSVLSRGIASIAIALFTFVRRDLFGLSSQFIITSCVVGFIFFTLREDQMHRPIQ